MARPLRSDPRRRHGAARRRPRQRGPQYPGRRDSRRGATRAARPAGMGVMVLELIAGADDEPGGALGRRDAAAHRPSSRLHAGPRFRDDFNMFRPDRALPRVVDERGDAIPDGYRETCAELTRIELPCPSAAASVPCHNDLLAENYIDDGEQLWLVDFEYSGNNDPTFELGNTCQELLRRRQIGRDLRRLLRRGLPGPLARMRLQMIMSDVGWTLWAAIQARISTSTTTSRAGRRSAGRGLVGARRPGLRVMARDGPRRLSGPV